MFNVLTVVFQKELEFLKIQAKSIELHIDINQVDNIIVVVNDSKEVCEQIDTSWYGSHASKVRIIHYSELGYINSRFKTPWPSETVGWENQQLCKLIAPTLFDGQWTLILDAKSILFKKFDYTLVSLNGAPIVNLSPTHEQFITSKEIVEELYKVDLSNVCTVGIPSWFHTETLRCLIADTEQITGEKFHDFFLTRTAHPTRLTEFYLYSGYVLKKYGSYEKLYPRLPTYHSVNFPAFEIEKFSDRLAEMQGSDTFIGMVHRETYAILDDEQKTAWLEFLLSKQLITDIEETKDALNKM